MPYVYESLEASQAESQLELPSAFLADGVSYARPFLKWAGGKRQLLPQLAQLYPRRGTVKRYVEPFLGGGAVYFHFKAMVEPRSALLWDNNRELVETFQAVQQNVDEVIALLTEYKRKHSKEFFLSMREKMPRSLTAKAARVIYLNKTCFNGLYRVNSRGIFNVPFGRYKDPGIFDEAVLRNASRELACATIDACDFRLFQLKAKKGDFVYFDPPYHPRSKTSDFTGYTRDSFGEKDQHDLARLFAALDKKGCLVMLSNSDTPLVRELYKKFEIRDVSARRSINARGDRRGHIGEVVVVNRRLLEAARGTC
jgi:DNA adenine methylase